MKLLDSVGAGTLFGLAVTPNGEGLYFVDDGSKQPATAPLTPTVLGRAGGTTASPPQSLVLVRARNLLPARVRFDVAQTNRGSKPRR